MNWNDFFRWFRNDVRDKAIKEITNELSRWFREEIRDKYKEYGTELFKEHAVEYLNDFWAKQAPYLRKYRKSIMTEVYKNTFGKL